MLYAIFIDKALRITWVAWKEVEYVLNVFDNYPNAVWSSQKQLFY